MRTPKTKEVKVIQGNYGYGWDDEAVYDKEEYGQIKSDLAEYRISGGSYHPCASYRVITRRVPL